MTHGLMGFIDETSMNRIEISKADKKQTRELDMKTNSLVFMSRKHLYYIDI